MEMDEHIKSCRYYNGEKKSPFHGGDNAMFWGYECWWVESFHDEQKRLVLQEALDRYQRFGLNSFDDSDGTPVSLKALLFNRYEHWLEGGPEDFKEWYRRVYKRDQ